jgi:hypothetical protein
MHTDKKQKLINDLSLALMYLTGWQEKDITGTSYTRSWKGYDFSVLDDLKDAGLIDFSLTAKSLDLSEEGEKRAQEIVRELMQNETQS